MAYYFAFPMHRSDGLRLGLGPYSLNDMKMRRRRRRRVNDGNEPLNPSPLRWGNAQKKFLVHKHIIYYNKWGKKGVRMHSMTGVVPSAHDQRARFPLSLSTYNASGQLTNPLRHGRVRVVSIHGHGLGRVWSDHTAWAAWCTVALFLRQLPRVCRQRPNWYISSTQSCPRWVATCCHLTPLLTGAAVLCTVSGLLLSLALQLQVAVMALLTDFRADWIDDNTTTFVIQLVHPPSLVPSQSLVVPLAQGAIARTAALFLVISDWTRIMIL